MHRRWDLFLKEIESSTEPNSTILHLSEMNVKQARLYNLIHEVLAHTYEGKHFPNQERKPTVYETLNQVMINYSSEKAFEIVVQWLYLVSRLEDKHVSELKLFHMVRISTLISYDDIKLVRRHPDWLKFRRRTLKKIRDASDYNWSPRYVLAPGTMTQ